MQAGERADPPMLVESTNEDGEVVIRRTRRHERVDLCEDADGDGSADEDAAAPTTWRLRGVNRLFAI